MVDRPRGGGRAAGRRYASDGSADDPGKMCMLQSQDDGRTLTFSVDTTTLVMTEPVGVVLDLAQPGLGAGTP
ncbi:hypothetical protein GCM10025868_19190 [Angustibacter aerolatus]|uniref:Uncharacterized protein n=1 Tax=Angustibacter aerolatus TaxID=1162965 RepID=A0ABQ6JFU9_9ACTN|nr:hypothetical protein [Angustibacter aerolatus]GMA86669.1 hypothetical protein GCM10025868_19190 [Angustibacter aerolatus]